VLRLSIVFISIVFVKMDTSTSSKKSKCKINIITAVDFSKYNTLNDSTVKAYLKMNNCIVPLLNNNFMTPDTINMDILNKHVNLVECTHNYIHIGNSQCRSTDEAHTSFFRCTLCNKIITKS